MIIQEIVKKEIWDDFIRAQKDIHILQTYNWGQFKSAQGWRPKRFFLTENGRPVAAYPILEKNIPIFNFRLWYLPRGPVADFADQNIGRQTIDHLLLSAQKNRVVFLKIDAGIAINENTQYIVPLLKEKGFHSPHPDKNYACTVLIDLDFDYEKIFESFKKNTRWEIRKSQKDGVTLSRISTPQDMDIFYQLYLDAIKGDNIKAFPKSYFQDLLKIFQDDILILVAYLDSVPLSAVLVACFGRRCWYMFGGSVKDRPTHYASQLLQNDVMKWAKTKGCVDYDLYGIPCGQPKDRHDVGILQFKTGFSGQKIKSAGEFDCFPWPFQRKL